MNPPLLVYAADYLHHEIGFRRAMVWSRFERHSGSL